MEPGARGASHRYRGIARCGNHTAPYRYVNGIRPDGDGTQAPLLLGALGPKARAVMPGLGIDVDTGSAVKVACGLSDSACYGWAWPCGAVAVAIRPAPDASRHLNATGAARGGPTGASCAPSADDYCVLGRGSSSPSRVTSTFSL